MSSFLQSDHVGTESEELLVKLMFFTGTVFSNLNYVFFFVFVSLNSGRMCLVCEGWKIIKICMFISVLLEIVSFTLFVTYQTSSSHELKQTN